MHTKGKLLQAKDILIRLAVMVYFYIFLSLDFRHICFPIFPHPHAYNEISFLLIKMDCTYYIVNPLMNE